MRSKMNFNRSRFLKVRFSGTPHEPSLLQVAKQASQAKALAGSLVTPFMRSSNEADFKKAASIEVHFAPHLVPEMEIS